MSLPTIYSTPSKGNINAISVSKNGEIIGVAQDSVGSKPTLTILNSKNGNLVNVVEASDDMYNRVTDLVFIDDTCVLFTIINNSNKVEFKTVNIQSNKKNLVSSIERPVGMVTINAYQGKFLIISKKSEIIDISDCSLMKRPFQLPDEINYKDVYNKINVVWFGNDEILVTGLKESAAQVWNIETRTWKGAFSGDFNTTSKIRITDKYLFITELFGNGIFSWNKEDRTILKLQDFNSPDLVVTAFDVDDQGEFVAIGNHTGYLQVLNIKQNDVVFEGRVAKGKIVATSINPIAKQVYIGSSDAKIVVVQL